MNLLRGWVAKPSNTFTSLALTIFRSLKPKIIKINAAFQFSNERKERAVNSRVKASSYSVEIFSV